MKVQKRKQYIVRATDLNDVKEATALFNTYCKEHGIAPNSYVRSYCHYHDKEFKQFGLDIIFTEVT